MYIRTFFEMYRKRTIKIDHMMALAITDDTERQMAAWLALPEFRRSPAALREVLTEAEVAASRPLAKFVGLETYQAVAGGPIRKDLFSEGCDDAVFLLDTPLLQRLAQEKLTAAAEALKPEAGAWIEISPHLDLVDLAAYSRVKNVSREPTPEESETLGQVTNELEQLEKKLDVVDENQDPDEDGSDEEGSDMDEDPDMAGEGLERGDGEDLYEQLKALRAEERVSFARRSGVPDPAQVALAGTLLGPSIAMDNSWCTGDFSKARTPNALANEGRNGPPRLCAQTGREGYPPHWHCD